MKDRQELWRLADVPLERLDDLPFGAIVVDADGRILAYNEYEARLSQRSRDAVIGRNFFRDVAPCTAVRAFEGRFRGFVSSRSGATVSESFSYFFPFPHGTVEVLISFIRLETGQRVLIAVERVDGAVSV